MIVPIADNPDVVAIIVTLGSDVKRLKSCIDTLYKQESPLKLAILCIINSPEVNVSESELEDVTIVTAGMNLGFSGGLNFARQFIASEYIWVIQDDMRISPTCLDDLYSRLSSEGRIVVASPLVILDSGVVKEGSCGGILQTSGDMERWLPAEATLPENLTELELLSYVPSRGMLVKTKAWDDVLGVDSRYYPVLWTDVDFCTALKKKGWHFSTVISARVWHETNGSTPSMLGRFLGQRNNALFKAKWFEQSDSQKDPLRPCSASSLSGQINPKIKPELLATIAQSAADALLHLGREYTVKMQQEQEEKQTLVSRLSDQEAFFNGKIEEKNLPISEQQIKINQLSDACQTLQQELTQVYNSNSWRLTQPLRKLRGLITYLNIKS